MKRTHLLALVASVALLVPSLASAQILDSKHDLSSGSAASIRSTDTGQICVFCHTPHNSEIQKVIWNRSSPTSAAWTTTTVTVAGTTLPTALTVESGRCLSCHDGSTNINALHNQPNTGTPTMTGNTIPAGDTRVDIPGGDTAHPVSVAYAGETAYNGTNSGATADSSLGNYWATTTTCNGGIAACTTAPTTSGRNGAAIRLYPDTTGGDIGVECGSCHEPHNTYGIYAFLRVDNTTNSGLCQSCHRK